MEKTQLVSTLAIARNFDNPQYVFHAFKELLISPDYSESLWHLSYLSVIQRFFGYTRGDRAKYSLPDISNAAERVYLYMLEMSSFAARALAKRSTSGDGSIVPHPDDGFFVPLSGTRTEIAHALHLNVTRVKDYLAELANTGLIAVGGTPKCETYFVSKTRYLEILHSFNDSLDDDTFFNDMARTLTFGRLKEVKKVREKPLSQLGFSADLLVRGDFLRKVDVRAAYIPIGEMYETVRCNSVDSKTYDYSVAAITSLKSRRLFGGTN